MSRTVAQARRDGRAAIAEISESPQLDADLLLGNVLNWERAKLIAEPNRPLSQHEETAFDACVRDRAAGEPIAYAVGTREWFGLTLRVTNAVLIPRPETEVVAQFAIDLAQDISARTLLDVGTGSGAIAIAMTLALPDAQVIATDVNDAAIRVAQTNVDAYDLTSRVTILHSNLLTEVHDEPDLIVANLPYLFTSDEETLQLELRCEPRLALFGGDDGLDLIRGLLSQVAERRWRSAIILEIDPRHADILAGFVRETLPQFEISIHQDLAGRDRVAILRHNGSVNVELSSRNTPSAKLCAICGETPVSKL